MAQLAEVVDRLKAAVEAQKNPSEKLQQMFENALQAYYDAAMPDGAGDRP